MGVTSSIAFTDDQKTIITKHLLTSYNDPSNAGKTPEELHQILMEEFNQIVKNFEKKSPLVDATVQSTGKTPDPSPSGKTARRNNLSKSSFGGEENSSRGNNKTDPWKQDKSRKGGARRRSFDTESKVNIPVTKKSGTADALADAVSKAAALASSQSAPELDVTTTAVDSWDSVSTQPYCDLCKMAFKNKAFLERHCKYSNLHIHNEKLASGVEAEETKLESVTEDAVGIKTAEPQEEGKHYRLLYSGSKFYWRIQLNVDYDIYHHFESKTIEIIPHNNNHQKELPRFYLDYDLAVNMVADAVEAEVENRIKNDAMTNRFAAPSNKDAIREDVRLQKLVTYLLSRLMFENDENHGRASIVELTGDHFPENFQLKEPPPSIVPMKVTRRRRSSTEEIDETMGNLAMSLDHASKLSSEATLHVHRAGTWDEGDTSVRNPPTPSTKVPLPMVDESNLAEDPAAA